MDQLPEYNEQTERKANQLIRLALAYHTRKTPLRREEIGKNIKLDATTKLNLVFECAQSKLRKTFGMELAELPVKENTSLGTKALSQKRTLSQVRAKTSKTYILKSLLPSELISTKPPISMKSNENRTLAVLMVSLSIIFIYNHSIPHRALTKQLLAMGQIQIKEIREILTYLVKKLYLTKRASEQNNGMASIAEKHQSDEEYMDLTFDYVWGSRAKLEFNTLNLFGFMKEMYGDKVPPNLEAQLNRIAEERDAINNP